MYFQKRVSSSYTATLIPTPCYVSLSGIKLKNPLLPVKMDLETGLLGEQGQLLCYREFCGAHPVAGVQERQI